MNSSTSEGASARLASRKSRHCAKVAGLPSVAAATLQNTPTSLLRTISRRSTCTQRSITMLSMRPIRPAASATPMKSSAARIWSVVVAQPRHRLVEAHLALRQRHHRLQIDVDAVVVDRVLDRRQGSARARCGRRSGRGWRARRLPACAGRRRGDDRPRRAIVGAGCGSAGGRAPRGRRSRPACRHGRRPRPRAA